MNISASTWKYARVSKAANLHLLARLTEAVKHDEKSNDLSLRIMTECLIITF